MVCLLRDSGVSVRIGTGKNGGARTFAAKSTAAANKVPTRKTDAFALIEGHPAENHFPLVLTALVVSLFRPFGLLLWCGDYVFAPIKYRFSGSQVRKERCQHNVRVFLAYLTNSLTEAHPYGVR